MTAGRRRVLLGIGSNLQREYHIALALDALAHTYGELDISRVFESEPVGVEGANNFYNLVVGFYSDIEVGALSQWAKQLEVATGRRPEDGRAAPKHLDIDLLCVGDLHGVVSGITLPRDEILTSAFVLRPLAESFGSELHPVSGLSYAELWRSFQAAQQLWPIHFDWKGIAISRPDAPSTDKPHS